MVWPLVLGVVGVSLLAYWLTRSEGGRAMLARAVEQAKAREQESLRAPGSGITSGAGAAAGRGSGQNVGQAGTQTAGLVGQRPDSRDGAPATPPRTFAPLEVWRRSAFFPVTEDEDVDAPASKFGGLPWLPTGVEWPLCGGCSKPLTLLAQLEIASLPPAVGAAGAGLLQVFYCIEASGPSSCDSWEDDSDAVCVRLVESHGYGANGESGVDPSALPAHRVVGWVECDDWPSSIDWDTLGIALSPEDESDFDALEDRDLAPTPRGRDKVGGWPLWVQGAEWGHCQLCNQQMIPLLQIDSEDHVAYMFGDSGIAHVCQCPAHPEQLSWGWACY